MMKKISLAALAFAMSFFCACDTNSSSGSNEDLLYSKSTGNKTNGFFCDVVATDNSVAVEAQYYTNGSFMETDYRFVAENANAFKSNLWYVVDYKFKDMPKSEVYGMCHDLNSLAEEDGEYNCSLKGGHLKILNRDDFASNDMPRLKTYMMDLCDTLYLNYTMNQSGYNNSEYSGNDYGDYGGEEDGSDSCFVNTISELHKVATFIDGDERVELTLLYSDSALSVTYDFENVSVSDVQGLCSDYKRSMKNVEVVCTDSSVAFSGNVDEDVASEAIDDIIDAYCPQDSQSAYARASFTMTKFVRAFSK